MEQGNAIEVRNIKKKFKLFYDKGHSLKELALFKERRRFEERTVLDGISFSVKKGEAIGLIGQNGCGKSTTLKLLSKIMYPDAGEIEMSGRVSSLIELGAGFHPDMSGRENIYINASIFGLTKREIKQRMDDIIAFSELGEFIDNPVRTYSSGMYMRLAFAVAINVDADILLIDEILAVGDAAFQAKCFNRLREIKAQGTTIVIVSHSLGQIEQICDRSLWIHEGKIKADGIPRDVHPFYMEYMGEVQQKHREREKAPEESEETGNPPLTSSESIGNQSIVIRQVKTLAEDGMDKNVFETGQQVQLYIEYEVKQASEDACIGIAIFRSDDVHCYGTNTRADKLYHISLKSNGSIKVILENELLPGKYFVDVAIESSYGIYADYKKKVCSFITHTAYEDIGVSRIRHKWVGECFENN